MNYEEKYKKALEIAKEWKSGLAGNGDLNMCLDELFPELRENEDEAARKKCLKYLDWTYQKVTDEDIRNDIEKCVAWLESLHPHIKLL